MVRGDKMGIEQPTQRRFTVMGDNAFKIADKIMLNQNICRLLKYQVRDPFNTDKYPDVDGTDLINKQILIVPKVYDDNTEKMSYITALFDHFNVNSLNPDFKNTCIRFDIACPYDEWLLNERSLRPYLLMQEIDTIFNESKLAGIGTLQFRQAVPLTLTPWIGGYSMYYYIDEFN